jgi:hypothetical protein
MFDSGRATILRVEQTSGHAASKGVDLIATRRNRRPSCAISRLTAWWRTGSDNAGKGTIGI